MYTLKSLLCTVFAPFENLLEKKRICFTGLETGFKPVLFIINGPKREIGLPHLYQEICPTGIKKIYPRTIDI